MNIDSFTIRTILLMQVLFAGSGFGLRLTAQDESWKACGTYPATVNVFAVTQIDGQFVVSTDRGLYTYDRTTHIMTRYDDSFSGTLPNANRAKYTLAARAGLNGRLFAYMSQPGQLVYSDNSGKDWNSTSIPTGQAMYSGIAVFDNGVILVTTTNVGASTGPRGIAISYDNGDSWERLTEPHGDTLARPLPVTSCYNAGQLGFYQVDYSWDSKHHSGLMVTSDGGHTWRRTEFSLVTEKLIYGDDSTVLYYSLRRVTRLNFDNGTNTSYVLAENVELTSVYKDGDNIIVAIRRMKSDKTILDYSILTLDSSLVLIDSITVPQAVRSITRIDGELCVVLPIRISFRNDTTVVLGPITRDLTETDRLLAGIQPAVDHIITLSQTAISRTEGCSLSQASHMFEKVADRLYGLSIDTMGVNICTVYDAYRLDFETGNVVDLHRSISKQLGKTYSLFQSIMRSRSGRYIANVYYVGKSDSVIPAIYVSDDTCRTWRAITNGWSDRLVRFGGSIRGSAIVETPSSVLLTGIRNGSVVSDTLDLNFEGSGLYRSLDNGESWLAPVAGTPLQGVHIWGLAAAETATYALAARMVSFDGDLVPSETVNLYSSIDDGLQWRVCSGGKTINLTSDSRLAVFKDTMFVFEIRASGRVMYSTDLGESFKMYIGPVDGTLAWFSNGPAGPILTTDRGVFIKGSSSTGVENDEPRGRSFIPWIVVSPVPSSDLLSVAFSHLNDNLEGITSAKMYSTTGDVVFDFTEGVKSALRSGSITFDVDCATLADGVYLVHMAAGRDSLTRKVMIKK